MFEFFSIHMNIRHKVVLGLVVMMLVIGSIGGMFYHYLREVERKQQFVEVADDLRDIILEIRRYEKNYLLYGAKEDLAAHQGYIREGVDMLGKVFPGVRDFRGAPLLNHLKQELLDYSQAMERLAAARQQHDSGAVTLQLEEQMRERGKAIVELSQQVVAFERDRILNIIRSLKAQLVLLLGMFVVFGSVVIPFVARSIIRPLRVIERTTHRIAQGDFRPVPVWNTRDETQRVVEAFNRMIAEIEKRQDQLLQAKKMASLGTLTSGIAHQLNNPLNNISTSCQILLEEIDSADKEFMAKMLNNVEQEVHRARDTVRGLLEFSRIKEFSLAPMPLAQVVDRAVKLISSQVPPGIEIVKSIPEDLMLQLDAQRMQQVFLNLIENAIHAIGTPPGAIRISAGVDAEAKEAFVRVEDTGAGISEEVKGHIFDPFFTTKEVGAGTGLGLSVVYGIIKKHNGSISVDSVEGEGARFIIRLPMESAA
jgi:signal transduction histidine kinase